MAVDRFTKDRFEEALPKDKKTGQPLWHDVGFEGGEFVYGINYFKPGQIKGIDHPWVTIHIRSSIDMTLKAKATGQDSIRMYFMRHGKPHGSKLSHYVTRVNGWEERMTDQLRILYKRAMQLSECPVCKGPKAVFKKKADGSLFQACPDHFSKSYEKFEE